VPPRRRASPCLLREQPTTPAQSFATSPADAAPALPLARDCPAAAPPPITDPYRSQADPHHLYSAFETAAVADPIVSLAPSYLPVLCRLLPPEFTSPEFPLPDRRLAAPEDPRAKFLEKNKRKKKEKKLGSFIFLFLFILFISFKF